MSTEAMKDAYEREKKAYAYDGKSQQWQMGFERGFKEGYAANQEALIKATLDAAKEKCESEHAGWQEMGYGRSVAKRIADIIRQITPQQVMERMK